MKNYFHKTFGTRGLTNLYSHENFETDLLLKLYFVSSDEPWYLKFIRKKIISE